jgi:predicted transport protein
LFEGSSQPRWEGRRRPRETIRWQRLSSGKAFELQGDASDLEKPLQTLIENNLEPLLGIRFLATEYATGKTHGGRIDSLGLDENDCPVILEYKRSVGENVINQGLFYLDWLMDHKAEFELLVMKKLGHAAAAEIDWSAPRLICVAADFTKYDGHAVQQINRNIELIRYRRFGEELLLLELASGSDAAGTKNAGRPARAPSSADAVSSPAGSGISRPVGPDKSYPEVLATALQPVVDVVRSLEDHIMSLGDDIQRKELRLYVAFKRLKNFATIVVQKNRALLYLHVNPDAVGPLAPNMRDVRPIGHWGTGDLEISMAAQQDLDPAKGLILQAYEGRAGVSAAA